jgi:integrase
MDDLVDVMLAEGRTASGTRNVLYVLSAMFIDAVRDEKAEFNPAQYATVRDSDPRVQTKSRKRVISTWDEMHAFARAAGQYEPMVRVLSDCGLRVGEMLALHCKHVRDDVLLVEQNAWEGSTQAGTKSGEQREVPLPPELAVILKRVKFGRVGLLFPTATGSMWHTSYFYRAVWYPAQRASGLSLLPHDMRHSYVSLLRAAGVDPADLASSTGHTVQTATARYTHSTGGTMDLIRSVAGG